jgi:hypothetical protein
MLDIEERNEGEKDNDVLGVDVWLICGCNGIEVSGNFVVVGIVGCFVRVNMGVIGIHVTGVLRLSVWLICNCVGTKVVTGVVARVGCLDGGKVGTIGIAVSLTRKGAGNEIVGFMTVSGCDEGKDVLGENVGLEVGESEGNKFGLEVGNKSVGSKFGLEVGDKSVGDKVVDEAGFNVGDFVTGFLLT